MRTAYAQDSLGIATEVSRSARVEVQARAWPFCGRYPWLALQVTLAFTC